MQPRNGAAVVERNDLADAWPLTDAGLRGKLVGAWIEANESHPALVPYELRELREALVADTPTDHPLWVAFERTQLAEFRDAWDHINWDHLGYAGNPRVVGPGLELVILLDKGTSEPIVVETATAFPGVGFVMRHLNEGGWLLHDFADLPADQLG